MSDDPFYPDPSFLTTLDDVDLGDRPLRLAVHHLEFGATEIRLGTGMHRLVIPFRDLVQIAAVDPWPRLEIEWRHVGGTTRREIRPRYRKLEDVFGERVSEVFANVERGFPKESDRVQRGWLDHEIVEWETVDAFPVDPTVADGDGAYRTAGRTPDRVVLAYRPGPSAFETLLQWIASRPGMEWSNHPREVVVTKEHVYATHRDGSVARLPLQRLRTARSSSSGDRLFVFGRNTRLLLPRRDGCTVVAALDRVVAGEALHGA